MPDGAVTPSAGPVPGSTGPAPGPAPAPNDQVGWRTGAGPAAIGSCHDAAVPAPHPVRPGFETHGGRARRPRWAGAALVGALLVTGVSGGAPAVAAAGTRGPTRPLSATGIAHWRKLGSYTENTLYAGEGVATVTRADHRSSELYRGLLSVPKSLAAEGWTHIGDPDSVDGDIIDAYQWSSSDHAKMFLVTTPSGATYQYVHPLVAGELYNNSFDAISPGAQWMVAGEWGTMSHLQVYPTPLLNHATPARGGPLHLAGYIRLDHRVNDIQGCDFIDRTTLICASDDDSRTLFANEKPLLEVELPRPLRGGNVKGHVVDLGSIPQHSTCAGTFEAEGVDYDVTTGILRVEIIQPGSCILKTTVYRYAATHR
jgi:hypothetical protein